MRHPQGMEPPRVERSVRQSERRWTLISDRRCGRARIPILVPDEEEGKVIPTRLRGAAPRCVRQGPPGSDRRSIGFFAPWRSPASGGSRTSLTAISSLKAYRGAASRTWTAWRLGSTPSGATAHPPTSSPAYYSDQLQLYAASLSGPGGASIRPSRVRSATHVPYSADAPRLRDGQGE